MVGGNLCLLSTMCGTPDQLDFRGKILFIEDIDEAGYRVDRLIQQLRSAGSLTGVKGVVCGEFIGWERPQYVDYGIREILMDRLGELGVPVLGSVPIGHGAQNRSFVWGTSVTIGQDQLVWNE